VRGTLHENDEEVVMDIEDMDGAVWKAWKIAEANMDAAAKTMLDARIIKTRIILEIKASYNASNEETARLLGYRPASPGGSAKGKLTTYFMAARALEKAGRANVPIEAPITDNDRETVAAAWGGESARVAKLRGIAKGRNGE
jgi:hypothetical protein